MSDHCSLVIVSTFLPRCLSQFFWVYVPPSRLCSHAHMPRAVGSTSKYFRLCRSLFVLFFFYFTQFVHPVRLSVRCFHSPTFTVSCLFIFSLFFLFSLWSIRVRRYYCYSGSLSDVCSHSWFCDRTHCHSRFGTRQRHSTTGSDPLLPRATLLLRFRKKKRNWKMDGQRVGRAHAPRPLVVK